MAAWGRTLRVLLATPLLAIGLLLAVGTFSEEGRAGGSTVLAQAKQHVAAVLHVSSETGAAGVAEVKADAAIAPVKASTTSGETGSAGTVRRPGLPVPTCEVRMTHPARPRLTKLWCVRSRRRRPSQEAESHSAVR